MLLIPKLLVLLTKALAVSLMPKDWVILPKLLAFLPKLLPTPLPLFFSKGLKVLAMLLMPKVLVFLPKLLA
jgi:hypothetical protein